MLYPEQSSIYGPQLWFQPGWRGLVVLFLPQHRASHPPCYGLNHRIPYLYRDETVSLISLTSSLLFARGVADRERVPVKPGVKESAGVLFLAKKTGLFYGRVPTQRPSGHENAGFLWPEWRKGPTTDRFSPRQSRSRLAGRFSVSRPVLD